MNLVSPSAQSMKQLANQVARRRWRAVTVVALLALVFVPRLLDLDRFINFDGATHWMARSTTFYSAIAKGEFAGTVKSSHPGVTVMIMTGASTMLGSLIKFGTPSPWGHFTELVFFAKLPLAVCSGLGLVLAGWIVHRHLGQTFFAILMTFFLAVDPLFLGHSRLLHLDSTNTVFVLLSLLCFGCYFNAGKQSQLIQSAFFAGLGILTRSTSLALVPFVLVLMLVGARSGQRTILEQLKHFAMWGCTTAAVFVVVWPAMWVAPLDTVHRLVGGVEIAYNEVDADADDVMFQESAEDVPKVQRILFSARMFKDFLLLRFPHALILGSIGIACLSYRCWQRRAEPLDITLAILVCFAIPLIIGLSFFQKVNVNAQAYRYALVSYTVFQVMAAYGLYVCFNALWRNRAIAARSFAILLLLTTCAWSSYRTLSLHPYYQVYHNDFISARYTGYGEGFELVADYLNRLENAESLTVASDDASCLSYFFHGKTLWAEYAATQDVDYVVVYNPMVHPRRSGGYLLKHYHYNESQQPEFVAIIHGMEVAWLYRASRNHDPS